MPSLAAAAVGYFDLCDLLSFSNMPEQVHPIVKLLQDDRRYKLDAYQFVRDGLAYAQDVLHLGEKGPTTESSEEGAARVEQHLTGQQLCEAIRLYAIEQYGLMAKTVLNSWGLHATSDFGEVVYNLIRVGLMKKSKSDRREDFNDCYNFDDAFVSRFEIEKSGKSTRAE